MQKLSLKKAVIHNLERADAGNVLGGYGENTSRNADVGLPADTTISIAVPTLTVVVSVKPQKRAADVSADLPPVCTGRTN